jgi:phosphopantothenoylcysteine decarboxylase/phosphopantothenate--cysteine ligase
LKSKRVLITAGPTLEPLDPVRFISNFSTGEMGYRIAEAAQKLRHQVTLLSGPTHIEPPKRVKIIAFQSGIDLSMKLIKEFKKTDILFMTAAICDYAPRKIASKKIKRDQRISLSLRATPDLLKKLIPLKKKNQKVIGFCLETDHLEKKAKKKLKRKNLDAIVGNFISAKNDPFGDKKTSVLLIDRNGREIWIEKQSKREIARFLVKQYC